MKTEDLMIGDWVKISHRNKIGKVYRIDRANGKGNGHAAVIDGDYHESDLEPIPLTTEILEKNFHEPDEGVVWWPNDEPYYHIECLPLNGTRIVMPYTQYVHQLQQALRLCGIRKEIVL